MRKLRDDCRASSRYGITVPERSARKMLCRAGMLGMGIWDMGF